MNSRKMAIIALVVVAALVFAPLCAEQSDAATSEDISLTLPDPSSGVVEVSVGNGGSQSSSYTPVTATPDKWDNVKRSELTYELLIYSFADSDGDGIGDLRGVMSKLDYIEALGATAIWLSPVHPADSYHGYDVTDYTAVNPDYGTMEDFDRFLAEALGVPRGDVRLISGQTARLKRFALPLSPAEAQARLAQLC